MLIANIIFLQELFDLISAMFLSPVSMFQDKLSGFTQRYMIRIKGGAESPSLPPIVASDPV